MIILNNCQEIKLGMQGIGSNRTDFLFPKVKSKENGDTLCALCEILCALCVTFSTLFLYKLFVTQRTQRSAKQRKGRNVAIYFP